MNDDCEHLTVDLDITNTAENIQNYLKYFITFALHLIDQYNNLNHLSLL